MPEPDTTDRLVARVTAHPEWSALILRDAVAALQELNAAERSLLETGGLNAKALSDAFQRCAVAQEAAAAVLRRASEVPELRKMED